MKTIHDLDFSSKKVLLRLDLNVPLDKGKVADDFRIKESIRTINKILEECKQLIIISHLGRPKGQAAKELSLKPVADHLGEILGKEVEFVDDCITESLPDSKLVMLENLRFHKEEESNDRAFAEKLASYADIYVNDAFAVCHRSHASTVGVPKIIPGCIGLLVQDELKFLSLDGASSPITAILGGAKLETKIPVIKNLLPKVDKLLLGGAMIFTFYRAKGLETGKSLLDEKYIVDAKELLGNDKILLPKDVVIANDKDSSKGDAVKADAIPKGKIGLDIGPESLEEFKHALRRSRTILWNGPLGYYENKEFAKATDEMAKFLSEVTPAITIIGGGDTASVVNKLGLIKKFNHVSTGGGASLEVLAGNKLPALEALEN